MEEHTRVFHLLFQRHFVITQDSFARPLPELMRSDTASALCFPKIEVREIK